MLHLWKSRHYLDSWASCAGCWHRCAATDEAAKWRQHSTLSSAVVPNLQWNVLT